MRGVVSDQMEGIADMLETVIFDTGVTGMVFKIVPIVGGIADGDAAHTDVFKDAILYGERRGIVDRLYAVATDRVETAVTHREMARVFGEDRRVAQSADTAHAVRLSRHDGVFADVFGGHAREAQVFYGKAVDPFENEKIFESRVFDRKGIRRDVFGEAKGEKTVFIVVGVGIGLGDKGGRIAEEGGSVSDVENF